MLNKTRAKIFIVGGWGFAFSNFSYKKGEVGKIEGLF